MSIKQVTFDELLEQLRAKYTDAQTEWRNCAECGKVVGLCQGTVCGRGARHFFVHTECIAALDARLSAADRHSAEVKAWQAERDSATRERDLWIAEARTLKAERDALKQERDAFKPAQGWRPVTRALFERLVRHLETATAHMGGDIDDDAHDAVAEGWELIASRNLTDDEAAAMLAHDGIDPAAAYERLCVKVRKAKLGDLSAIHWHDDNADGNCSPCVNPECAKPLPAPPAAPPVAQPEPAALIDDSEAPEFAPPPRTPGCTCCGKGMCAACKAQCRYFTAPTPAPATPCEGCARLTAERDHAALRLQCDGGRLADEVAVLIRQRVIDSRSPAADALLDFREPPSSPRADRLAVLDAEVERLRTRDLEHVATIATQDGELDRLRAECEQLNGELGHLRQLRGLVRCAVSSVADWQGLRDLLLRLPRLVQRSPRRSGRSCRSA